MKTNQFESFQLFDYYDVNLEHNGEFSYLDVKAIPIGIFGNLLLRILNEYKRSHNLEYVDHFIIQDFGLEKRVIFLFKDIEG